NPLGAYAQTFQRLFGTPAAELLQPRNRVARQLQAKAALAPPSNLMQLPWRQGYSWQPNGAHSNSGSGYPFSSFDASYDWPRWGSATYSVVAAHAGTVRVLSRCQVRVTHPSGWATNYYHMDQIQVSNGQQVSADTKLGVYAGNINTALCEGGSSTGPHLHFSLLYNGAFVSLQGASFGPYRINVGTSNYDNDCRRYYFYNQSAGTTHCAFRPLYNPGLAL
ncbi:protease LasA, partial [Pseudomonas aeruginosa]|nr:protease LasA [Pseudomonas aeruginosa]